VVDVAQQLVGRVQSGVARSVVGRVQSGVARAAVQLGVLLVRGERRVRAVCARRHNERARLAVEVEVRAVLAGGVLRPFQGHVRGQVGQEERARVRVRVGAAVGDGTREGVLLGNRAGAVRAPGLPQEFQVLGYHRQLGGEVCDGGVVTGVVLASERDQRVLVSVLLLQQGVGLVKHLNLVRAEHAVLGPVLLVGAERGVGPVRRVALERARLPPAVVPARAPERRAPALNLGGL
jgi:hypothetical protein